MIRQDYNRTFGIAPVVMSLMALALVIFAATTGWQTNLPDEGLAAHTFQLLIFSQPVLVALFLATADWKRPLRVAGLLALQALGAGLALGALFYLESRGP
jgi:hypothetical protein